MVPGGDLFDVIAQRGNLPEKEAQRFFRQIISGVEYCHSNLVAHRDLKPENILIDENQNIQLADFGLSNVMNDGHYLKTSCGSPNYAAPEVISGKIYCGTDIDTWSCGVILYALLAGYLPFEEEGMQDLYQQIKAADYVMPKHFSPEAKDLIKKILQPDPLQRLQFHEITLHPWMRESVPFYMELFHINSKVEKTRRIQPEVYNQMKTLPNINFHNLGDDKIRRLLKQQGQDDAKNEMEYSFLTVYNLLLDHKQKEEDKVQKTKIETEGEQSTIDNNLFKDYQNIYDQNPYWDPSTVLRYEDQQCSDSENLKNFVINEWSFVQRYKVGCQKLAITIIEIFKEPPRDTKIQTCHENYQMKCIYRTPSNINHSSSQNDLAINHNMMEMDENDLTQLSDVNSTEAEQERSNSKQRYSKREILFNIHIYSVPDKPEYHLLNLSLSKGHPLVFLDYYHRFIFRLEERLTHLMLL